MKKTNNLILILLLFISTYGYSEIDGILNDTNVRLRKEPSLTSAILGVLNEGDVVVINGRTQYRELIQNMNAYWLQVKHGNDTGWVFGYFVNINKNSYNDLNILENNTNTNYPRIEISESDLSVLLEKGLDPKKIQTDLYRNFLHDPNDILSFFCNERLRISKTIRWNAKNPEELFNLVKISLNQKRSIGILLPPTLEVGILETDRFYLVDSSEIAENLQTSYSSSIKISDYFALNDGGFFYLYNLNTTFYSSSIESKSVVFYIQRIKNSIFPNLTDSYIISSMVLSPYDLNQIRLKNEKAFRNLTNRDLNELPESEKIIYGK